MEINYKFFKKSEILGPYLHLLRKCSRGFVLMPSEASLGYEKIACSNNTCEYFGKQECDFTWEYMKPNFYISLLLEEDE